MVFNVNNNGDPFKLPKIKIDLSQGLVGAGDSVSVFGNQKTIEESLFLIFIVSLIIKLPIRVSQSGTLQQI